MAETHHSKSLYMIVKKTCKNKLTALISTANKYNHASPDIMMGYVYGREGADRDRV